MKRNQLIYRKILHWFDNQAEQAANFYVTVFKNSKMGQVTRYGKEGYEIYGMEEGTGMTVEFDLERQKFMALNGGPVFKFNEAISFQVFCDTQEELDYYWEKLSEDGDKNAQQCGWSKIIQDQDQIKSQRVIKAMLQMQKLDIQTLI